MKKPKLMSNQLFTATSKYLAKKQWKNESPAMETFLVEADVAI